MQLRFGQLTALLLATSAWVIAVGAGFKTLLDYASAPGSAANPVIDWPAQTRVPFDPARANLVMFAHPHCPCTRASIDSLTRIMMRCQGAIAAHVVYCRPAGFSEGWEQTDLWHSAAAIPGVHVLADEQGQEAQRFGAMTSGQVLLYSPRGVLVFSGGITIARGHMGDNAGQDAVIALVTGRGADRIPCPVYGCPLHTPADGDTP